MITGIDEVGQVGQMLHGGKRLELVIENGKIVSSTIEDEEFEIREVHLIATASGCEVKIRRRINTTSEIVEWSDIWLLKPNIYLTALRGDADAS